jgi:Ca2+-binding RTX toxin-like protein
MTESANVPSGAGGTHDPLSAVSFDGGAGSDRVSFDDGPAKKRATYSIGDERIKKTPGPPALSFGHVETVWLYPQDGPSDIGIGTTGGALVQVFGNFFGQRGPDRIDARGADASVVVTGSLGDDTILGGPFFDLLAGGGGRDAIDARDMASDRVECDGGKGRVRVDKLDTAVRCPTAKRSAPLLALWKAHFAPRKAASGAKLHLQASSTAAGKVRLTFRRHKGNGLVTEGTATKPLRTGPTTVTIGPKVTRSGHKRALPKGRYSVKARLQRGGAKSKAVTLGLTIG